MVKSTADLQMKHTGQVTKVKSLEKEKAGLESGLGKRVQEIVALDSDINALRDDNRRLKATREKKDTYYTEREAGDYVFSGIPGEIIRSRILPGLEVDDRIQVGASGEVMFRVRIVQVTSKEAGTYEPLVSSEPVKTWRHNYNVNRNGDYAVILESVLGAGIVYMQICTQTRSQGAALMKVVGW
jgi:hypothetical protein